MGKKRANPARGDNGLSGPAAVGVTVERIWFRRLTATALVMMLGVVGFAAGRAAAGQFEAIGSDELAFSGTQDGTSPVGGGDGRPATPPESPPGPDGDGAEGAAEGAEEPPTPAARPAATGSSGPADPGGAADGTSEGSASGASPDDRQLKTLRFVPFPDPVVLIEDETKPDLNNSVGLDTTDLDTTADEPGIATEVAAVAVDLVVRGPAETTVSVHPGDRPNDAVRFAIPSNGRLLVPHLIAPTDDAGRIVVSASEQVEVEMTGLGTFVAAQRTRSGRFVATDSIRIGSLVTATDGRNLTISLSDVLGPESAHVGHAVVRVNANISPQGGSVAVNDGPDIPWPAPATPDLGLAGTELLTVAPTSTGQIVMDYLGGSVLTVDLVGYYTGEAAPEADTGLLVLAPRPILKAEEVGADDEVFDLGPAALPRETAAVLSLPRTLITAETADRGTGGSVSFWNESGPVPGSPAYALAPGQRRHSTEWLDRSGGTRTAVRAPDGADVRIWVLGGFT